LHKERQASTVVPVTNLHHNKHNCRSRFQQIVFPTLNVLCWKTWGCNSSSRPWNCDSNM